LVKKKAVVLGIERKRECVKTAHPEISIVQQCFLLGLPRSSFYYQPMETENAENLHLMRMIDKMYTKYPFLGSPRITDQLQLMGYPINHKRIERLMGIMGLRATVPGPHTSKKHPENRIYPYLLKDVKIEYPNQVWCTDITYIPLWKGFMYLVAIMDWFSRYVLAWELSNTLETTFCVEAVQDALKKGKPDILNSDQGCQFTSLEFTGLLENSGVRISMDGRGRVWDNIFIERLWRTVKYEDIYIRDYSDGENLRSGLNEYFRFYNYKRRHQSLDKQTPAEVYFSRN